MIRPLRRAHFGIWCALALFLPVAFAAAYRVIPRPVMSPLPVRATADARGPVLATIDRPAALYRLRGSSDVGYQLEVVLKRPLRSPSVVVRVAGDGDGGGVILGTLDARGFARFDVGGERRERFVLSDPIRGEVVDTLDFATAATRGDEP